MKRVLCLLSTLTALFLLTACQEQDVNPGATATRSALQSFHSGVCDVFPTIDRSPIPSLPRADSTTPVNQVISGFQSVFAPGAQPVPCDRLHIDQVQGLTSFQGSLDASLPPATTNAFLEVSAFDQDGRLSVTDTELWVEGSGGVLSSHTGLTNERCRFRVKAVAPRFGSGTHAQGWLESTALATGTGQFFAPFSTPRMINVTQEFRRSLAGDGFVLALAIEPDDPSIQAKANNRCAGRFTVRLRLLGPE